MTPPYTIDLLAHASSVDPDQLTHRTKWSYILNIWKPKYQIIWSVCCVYLYFQIGPEKGVQHLATAAVINAFWDIFAKMENKVSQIYECLFLKTCTEIKQTREVLKTEAGDRGFQHLPRDLANVNALKNHVRSLLLYKNWKHLLHFAFFLALFCFAFSPMSRERCFYGQCLF